VGSQRRSRSLLIAVVVAATGAGLLGLPPAMAGPDPEPSASQFDVYYPGWFAMPRQARGRTVARVRFNNYGGSDSAVLRVCVTLPPGFRDVAVNGRRQRVRVSHGGRKVCWLAGAISPDEEHRATVRATAPRRSGRYDTEVRLIAVASTSTPGETLTRTGTVRVGR